MCNKKLFLVILARVKILNDDPLWIRVLYFSEDKKDTNDRKSRVKKGNKTREIQTFLIKNYSYYVLKP